MEALCQVLRIYDVGGKLLSGIKCMNVNSTACVRVKGRVCECFRIDSGVIQGFIRSTLVTVRVGTMINSSLKFLSYLVCFPVIFLIVFTSRYFLNK